MYGHLQVPLSPKNGLTLRGLGIARISTEHQNEKSLDEQIAKIKAFVEQAYAGPIEWEFLASRGSGENLDRQELFDAEERIASGLLDLVIAEDLARICRRKRAYDFCESCVDNDVRLIAINDRVDTSEEGWEDNAFISTWHHERSNRDTSGRIGRTLRGRFQGGGICQTFPYGYIKEPGAKHDSQIHKDPEAVPIIEKIFQMLEDGANYSEIADYLNSSGIATGEWSRRKRWKGSMVKKLVFNSIFKGVRTRNRKMSRRVNKTGKHKSVKAPPEMLIERHVPHLAFIDPERYDCVIAMLLERNGKYRRKAVDGVDPRQNVPNKRTRWPGQHLYCGCCGALYVFGGHGQTDHLMCTGARDYACWNGVTVDGPLAARKMAEAIFHEIESLPGFDTSFEETVRQEWLVQDQEMQRELQQVDRELQRVDREVRNITAAIRDGGSNSILLQELQSLDAEKRGWETRRLKLTKRSSEPPKLPSIQELKRLAREKLSGLLEHSQEASRLLRRMISRIEVCPYRLCDGGRVVLRAKFVLRLTSLIASGKLPAEALPCLERTLQVDLFDPPQREAVRKEVIVLRAQGLTEREVADRLNVTHTAAQRAAALQRLMDQLGRTDPYIEVIQPPEDCPKLKRHKHPRYKPQVKPASLSDE